MAWPRALQIYDVVKSKDDPKVLIPILNGIEKEAERAQVAKYVQELAEQDERPDIVEIARPYADRLNDFKRYDKEYQRFGP